MDKDQAKPLACHGSVDRMPRRLAEPSSPCAPAKQEGDAGQEEKIENARDVRIGHDACASGWEGRSAKSFAVTAPAVTS